MSVSAPQAQPQGQGQPQDQGPATGKFPDLQSLGQDIVSDISAFSAGLARIGAPATAIQRLQQMAGVFHEMNQVIQKEAPIPNPAHNPQQGAQQAPQQAQPQQGAQAGGPGNAHPALVSAVNALAKGYQPQQQQ